MMMPKTLEFFLNQLLLSNQQWSRAKKRGEEASTKFENLEDKRKFFGKIKSFL